MSAQQWADQALQSFDTVVQATGFRSRPGQRLMAEQVAQAFSRAQLGKIDADDENTPPPNARLP